MQEGNLIYVFQHKIHKLIDPVEIENFDFD